jgi:hypothetical protein
MEQFGIGRPCSGLARVMGWWARTPYRHDAWSGRRATDRADAVAYCTAQVGRERYWLRPVLGAGQPTAVSGRLLLSPSSA